VETCAKAFVGGIEGRKRTVFVPGWVGVAKRLRNLINSPVGERQALKHAPELLPEMDAEVQRLGRSTSARNVGS
jgi:hypothetical protein